MGVKFSYTLTLIGVAAFLLMIIGLVGFFQPDVNKAEAMGMLGVGGILMFGFVAFSISNLKK